MRPNKQHGVDPQERALKLETNALIQPDDDGDDDAEEEDANQFLANREMSLQCLPTSIHQ